MASQRWRKSEIAHMQEILKKNCTCQPCQGCGQIHELCDSCELVAQEYSREMLLYVKRTYWNYWYQREWDRDVQLNQRPVKPIPIPDMIAQAFKGERRWNI